MIKPVPTRAAPPDEPTEAGFAVRRSPVRARDDTG